MSLFFKTSFLLLIVNCSSSSGLVFIFVLVLFIAVDVIFAFVPKLTELVVVDVSTVVESWFKEGFTFTLLLLLSFKFVAVSSR